MEIARYSVEEILPILGSLRRHTFHLPNGRSYTIRTSCSRLLTFKNSLECVWCGCVGNVFKLEASRHYSPHLNLYYIKDPNSKHILMTRDHIIPKSMCGDDRPDNLQTMCEKCNQKKGDLLSLHFVCQMTDWPLAPEITKLRKLRHR